MNHVRAIYDGKALVLDEAVDWPEGTVVDVTRREATAEEIVRMKPQDAFAWLMNHPYKGGGADFDRDDAY